jgi:hypothetical protein
MKAKSESIGAALPVHKHGAKKELVNVTIQPFCTPTSIHFTEGWVDLGADLEECRKYPNWGSDQGPFSC